MRKVSRASRTSLKRISSGGVVLALVALFGLPTAAFAAGPTVVDVSANVLIATADAGTQVNSITVGNTGPVAGGGVSIKDTGPAGDGVTMTAAAGAAGCIDTVNDQIRCPFGTLVSVTVHAGPSNDLIIVLNDDLPTTANGGPGNDSLRGGAAAETFHGNAGTDSLVGGAGGDVLDGGPEFVAGDKDVADYGSATGAVSLSLDDVANDGLIDADPGTLGDQSEGDNLSNFLVLEGGAHADVLTGDTVTTDGITLIGNNGNDDINGGDGDDTLNGLGGADDFNDAEGGFDTVTYGSESEDVIVDLDNVNDDGPVGELDNVHDTIDRVIGGIGDDSLTGAAGVQTLNGGGGNDTINGDVGNDVIQGGSGTDTVSYALRANPVTVTLDGLAGDGEAGESDNIAVDVENILGGSGADNLTGSTGRNRIDGALGGDTMNGAGGDDNLVGTVGDAGDVLIGAGGTDVATYAAATAAATVSLDNGNNDNGEGDNVQSNIEKVTGSNFGDTIVGSASRNTLNGGCGNDTLSGDPGVAVSNDTLNGGPGNDTLHGNAGADSMNGGNGPGSTIACGVYTDADEIDGGIGSDLVSYSTRTNPVAVSLGAGVNNDGEAGEGDNVQADVERITGGRDNDNLQGNTGLDRLNGANGADTINGGAGGDILSGGNGDDTITGGTGKDTMSGSAGDDEFFAVDGVKDSITCGDGNDTVHKDPIDATSANCVP